MAQVARSAEYEAEFAFVAKDDGCTELMQREHSAEVQGSLLLQGLPV